ncbi:hypothetical protein F5141DRAFT_1039798 [Pisolithus sp. B1]|nr:hypothetical protein F5141DRAFT_1039798 [Pisolithus sp. B1]
MVSTRQRSRRQDDANDPAFLTLPAGLRRSIDEAFDTCAVPREQAFTRRNNNEIAVPGGFMTDNVGSATAHAEEEPGGFIVDSKSSTSRVQGSDKPGDDFYIPLSSIPRTLHLLDLESDDEILGVFRNAASGWGAGNADNEGVNRKDWRAICAVLLEGQEGNVLGSEETAAVEVEEDSGSEGDEYQMSVLSSEPEESSDEYHDDISGTAKSNQATSASRKPSSKFSASSSDAVHLTTEQRAICREDFARFFPAVSGAQLDGRRITAHEIMQAALLLKESLKPEEVGEMLQAFSSSEDGSISLEDFERMMAQTKMIRS